MQEEKNELEPTNHDILEAINSYATNTDRRLEKIEVRLDTMDGRLDTMDGRLDTMDGRLTRVESQMVTKEYLDERLGKFRSDITDYMDKRLLDLKGDLVVIMKSEDRKLSALVELLVHKSILTTSEARSIARMEPFPQGV
ncbi:hypothetical protein HYW94_03255 [Candidatus Uhrbacteria bacterium]|nr:hypothetical protein [Candidatus Uhrbacteria bacterium]